MSRIDRRRFLFQLGLGAGASALAAGCAGSFAEPPPPRPPEPAPPPGGGFAQPPPGDRMAALRAERQRQIQHLVAYRSNGVFPRNHRVLGRIPTFVDEHGNACAVGYLMLQSGWGPTVAQVRRDSNNIYIEQIHGGPVLEWILHSGLTQEECAYIQPSYDWERPEYPIRPPPPPDPEQVDRERLFAHFEQVERTLIDNTEASLRTALERLRI